MLNSFKDKMKTSSVLGTWVVTSSPQHCEIMGRAGMDFQILDMEHGTVDFADCENMIRACELGGSLPLVRLPNIDVGMAQRVLDSGAQGVIYPQVRSAADAKEAVRTLSFPPEGLRGFNPFTRAGNYGHGTNAYANAQPIKAIIIENKSALSELDEILSIDEIDIIYLGTYDMSVDYGVAGQMDSPQVVDFVTSVLPKIRQANKAAGVMVHQQQDMQSMLSLGANFLVKAVDSKVLFDAFAQSHANFENAREANSKKAH